MECFAMALMMGRCRRRQLRRQPTTTDNNNNNNRRRLGWIKQIQIAQFGSAKRVCTMADAVNDDDDCHLFSLSLSYLSLSLSPSAARVSLEFQRQQQCNRESRLRGTTNNNLATDIARPSRSIDLNRFPSESVVVDVLYDVSLLE